ncbi:glycosyltransferase family 2 protein [Sporolactobacillus putidus]|uniref:Glycosyltransferase 2-like domain-containing protein n=1 Tax=Sporolactobacillus putidus TaxID=492735 RepID=A0A917W1H0_9BACL|nr:glycosyltransferase [Sporolactobacillus putidus]GGL50718.1 hypothetical protein GCM10007968_13720 [Sporolactobacillus putidus]
MTEISIIVPVFKVEKYLPRCVESILHQTYKDFEVILVDDGSPDRCGEICERYAQKDNRVQVVHQPNQGTGAARNNGLFCAKGKYVYFCDPDDYIEPNLLEDNHRLAEKFKANMVIFGYYNEIVTSSASERIPKKVQSAFLETTADFRKRFGSLFKKEIMYTLWNKLYKKAFLDRHHCRFGSQKMGQDTLFNYGVYKHLSRVFLNNHIYYHYYMNRSSSALNRYRKDKFTIRYHENLKFEELINEWGFDEEYKDLITAEWIHTLSVGIDNLFHEQCDLKDREKRKKIQSLINAPKIEAHLKDVSWKEVEGPVTTKMKVLLSKNKKVTLLFYLLKLRKSVKSA